MTKKKKIEIKVTAYDKTKAAFASATAGVTHLADKVLSLKTAMVGAFAAIGSALAVNKLVELSDTQAKAVLGMEAALKSMGRYTPQTSQKIQELASAIQDVSNVGDESILVGTKLLVTFKNISNDILPRTIAAMTDLSALTGGDMATSANILGKASMGMVGALRRYGITVDADIFKTKGFAGVLAEIEAQVSGQAAAMREATGAHIALSNAFGDLGEKAGDALKVLMEPGLRALIPVVQAVGEKMAGMQKDADLAKWAEKIGRAVPEMAVAVVRGIGQIGDAVLGLSGLIDDILKKYNELKARLSHPWSLITTDESIKALQQGLHTEAPPLRPGGIRLPIPKPPPSTAESTQSAWDKLIRELVDAIRNSTSGKSQPLDLSKYTFPGGEKGASGGVTGGVETRLGGGTGSRKTANELDALAKKWERLIETPRDRYIKDLAEIERLHKAGTLIGSKYSAALQYIKDALNSDDIAMAKQLFEQTRTEEERALDQARELGRLLREGDINDDIYQRAMAGLSNGAEEATDKIGSLQDSIRLIGSQFSQTFADMATGARVNFTDLINSMLRDLLRLTMQMQVMEPLMQSLKGLDWGGLFNTLFGGGSTPSYAGAGTYGVNPGTTNWHAAGDYWFTEPTYAIGLNTGKTHMIAENEPEYLLGGMSKLRGRGSAGTGGSASIQVNVHNSGSEKTVERVEPRFNGRETVVDLWMSDGERNGKVAHMMRSMKGR